MHVHYVGREVMLRHIVERSNPNGTNQIVLRGRTTRGLPQTNRKLKGTYRGVCQEI